MERHRILGPATKIIALVLLLFGAYFALQWVNFAEVLKSERLIAYLNAEGPWAPLVFVLLMIASVVIIPIPSLPLDLAAGAVFGVFLGATYAVIGAEIGAIISFLIGRVLGREALAQLLRTDITFCERCSDRHLAIFVFLSRLLPVFSFDLISYGAGLTNMSVRAFAIATLLGMIPPTFAMTALGGSLFAVEWPWIIPGLVIVMFFLVLPKLVVKHSSSRWVRLLRGEAPVAAPSQAMPGEVSPPAEDSVERCSSCGGPVE